MQFIKNTAKSYLFFLIITSISSIIYTSIIYFSNTQISTNTLNIISFFASVVIFFILGIYISHIFKEKGLMNSFMISLILLLLILLLKIITKSFSVSWIIKSISCLLASSIGGIIGINFKRKKTI
ncbi:MAG: TIGR04086 family membrane protein [Bacilli bacterium]|nr:TIGR04086 family membrane protein [Bacilli bacterium]